MSGGDPIVAATTVGQLLGALDQVYGWTLPATVPDGSPLHDLWASAIVVTKAPAPGVLYAAAGTAPVSLAPMQATVQVSIKSASVNPPSKERFP